MKRHYATRFIQDDNEELREYLDFLHKLSEINYEEYQIRLKKLAKQIREAHQLDSFLGFPLTRKEGQSIAVTILIYDSLKATDDDFYDQKIDEETGIPYLEVSE